MTIIVFLVDTSASMTQRTYMGARLSVLDVAKDTVERFLKVSAQQVNTYIYIYTYLQCVFVYWLQ